MIAATPEVKTDAVATGASVVTAYAATLLAQRAGLPLEVASALVGLLSAAGFRLVQWVGSMIPSRGKS